MRFGSTRRLPGGLLGMLAIVVCVEGSLSAHGKTLRHPMAWEWFMAGRAARDKDKVEECQVLCFGDSLMKHGVSPQMIEHGTGLKTYNLAMGAGEMPGTYFTFRRALEAGARPKAILLDAAPFQLAKILYPSKLWPEVLGYRDCLELSVQARDPKFFAATVLAKLFSSIRDRDEIRNAVTASFRGQPPPIGEAFLPYLRNWKVNRGAELTTRPFDMAPNLLEMMAPALFPPVWRADPLSVHYLHKLLTLAQAHDIRVYWILPPMTPEVQARQDAMGIDADYIAFVKGFQVTYPHITVLDARRSGYGPLEHVDPIHLDARGALALSRDVAAVLRRDSGSLERWVPLPSFRDLPPEVEVEDLLKSVLAERARVRK